jgi:hypothetical protein
MCKHFQLPVRCVEIRFCCSNFVGRVTPALDSLSVRLSPGKRLLNLNPTYKTSFSFKFTYYLEATFTLYHTAFRSGAKKHLLYQYGMYNFQKLSETTSTESYPVQV